MIEFKPGNWTRSGDVHDFILRNYTPYDGDESFLAGPTEKTSALWEEVKELLDKRCV